MSQVQERIAILRAMLRKPNSEENRKAIIARIAELEGQVSDPDGLADEMRERIKNLTP